MREYEIEVRVRAKAGRSAVFEYVQDRSVWPEFSKLDSFEIERAGEGSAHGVGSIGILRRGRLTARERIVEVVPDRILSYELVSGLPVRDYRARVSLADVGDGTEIHWKAAFTPKIPGTGLLLRRVFRRALEEMATGIATRAQTGGESGRRVSDPRDWEARK